jgi:type IV secretion system protein VirB9
MNKAALVAILAPCLAHAEMTPAPGRVDSRVRWVNYVEGQVIRIPCALNVLTDIEFEEGEEVKTRYSAIPKMWSSNQDGNHLLIKPLRPEATTNMTVMTSNSKRSYSFYLDVIAEEATKKEALYALHFRYPDVEKQKDEAKEKEAEAEAKKEEMEERFDAALAHVYNTDYWVTDQCKEICPTAAHDDGNFVFLEFASNGLIPAVYGVTTEGKDKLVNSHVEGHTVIVERMQRKLTLRHGEQAAYVVNRSFAKGRDNVSGTVASDVELIVKEPR